MYGVCYERRNDIRRSGVFDKLVKWLMVDFKKLLSECRKQMTFPDNAMIELPKYCVLPKGHDGECMSYEQQKGDTV